jgi:hypothetical protein
LPVHKVSAAGSIEASFGSVEHVQPYREPDRLLATDGSLGLWVAEYHTFRLERFDAAGRTTQVLGVRDSLFGSPTMTRAKATTNRERHFRMIRAIGSRDITADLLRKPDRLLVRPTHALAGLDADGSGRLWVVAHVASANWREIKVTYPTDYPDEVLESDDLLPLKYSSVVYVIDPAARRVLARKEVPGYWRMLRAGLLVRWQYDAVGLVVGEVHDARLAR